MAWLCSCGLVNGGTNKFCPGSLQKTRVKHEQVSANTPDWVMAAIAAKELGMTPEEELFAKFYNEQKILVKDMELVQMREIRDELQKIAFEAKAKLVSTDDSIREKKAGTTKKEWLSSDPHPQITDSQRINLIEKRKTRMSKMDKITDQLRKAGIDDETIKEMTRNLEAKATDSKLKTVTFHKPATELGAVQVKLEKNGDSKPFNPASLGFACAKCKQNPCRCDGLAPVLAE